MLFRIRNLTRMVLPIILAVVWGWLYFLGFKYPVIHWIESGLFTVIMATFPIELIKEMEMWKV